MIELAIAFLAVSLLLYALFGGADFGAGIIELLSRRKHQRVIAHAIGPVWEANHVWLIVAVVVLFMGFPRIYTTLSVYLHIPLLLLLIGIVLRGTAFAFRHYDAIRDRSQQYYTLLFRVSSLFSPFLLGMITGAVMLGRIDPEATTFAAAFIDPWLNWFCVSVGLFTVCLFALLAAVYLTGETRDMEDRRLFMRRARLLSFSAVGAGALVFVAAEMHGLPLFTDFGREPIAVAALILATIALPLLWKSLEMGSVVWSRVLAVAQVSLILGVWFFVQFPVVIRIAGGANLTFASTAAPSATLLQLVLALIVGSCIIFPSLYFLFRTFKFDGAEEHDSV